MSLAVEYIRKLDFFINNVPKRMYKPVAEFGFEGFFTYEKIDC